jgi:acetyl esterase/lipase
MQQMSKNAGPRGVPGDIAPKLREMNNLNDEILKNTRALYIPILKTLPRTGFTIEKDVSYGSDPQRHLLDIHVPDKKPTNAPVVVFFHGGGLIAGNKNDVGELIYGNVSDFFARNGIIGVNATYRLAPAHKWPAGAEDVGAAVSWVHKNIAKYGGDPNNIFVMGHSAGATHVAQFGLHKDLPASPRAGVVGLILTSGGYTINSKAPNAVAYYGEDASKHAERGTPGNVVWGDFDIFISTAENEPFNFQQGMAILVNELAAKGGRMPRVKYLLDHNHFSQTLSFGTGDPMLADDVLDFVLTTSAKKNG